MTSKSKAKGAAFERDLAKKLSEMYGDSFQRVPNSGAFVGGSNAYRKQALSENQVKAFKGDIIPPDSWDHFNCEAKNYADFPFHRLLFNVPVPILETWLEQLMDASDPGDCNILFFKITRTGSFVAYEFEQDFTSSRHILYTDKSGKKWKVTEMDDFFSLNKDDFRKACL